MATYVKIKLGHHPKDEHEQCSGQKEMFIEHFLLPRAIFKCWWGPGIDSKEWITPAYVVWRAGTIILFLLVPSPHRLFKNSSSGLQNIILPLLLSEGSYRACHMFLGQSEQAGWNVPALHYLLWFFFSYLFFLQSRGVYSWMEHKFTSISFKLDSDLGNNIPLSFSCWTALRWTVGGWRWTEPTRRSRPSPRSLCRLFAGL